MDGASRGISGVPPRYQGMIRTGQVPRRSARLRRRMAMKPTTATISPSHKIASSAAPTSSMLTARA